MFSADESSPRSGGQKSDEDADVTTGVNQLANFGNILSNTLGAFSKNIHKLEDNQNRSGASLSDISHKFESQRKIVNDLGVEVEDIKLNVDEILRKIQLLEKEIASRIDDSNVHMQKEIMVQKTTTKIELNNMKQTIHNSLNETLELFAKIQGDINKDPISSLAGLSDNEKLTKCAERLGKIESALNIQSRFNQQMSRAVENDGFMQLDSFEVVHQQIAALETSLKQTKSENYNLKVSLEDVKSQLAKALKGKSRFGSRPVSALGEMDPHFESDSVNGRLDDFGQTLATGLAARVSTNGMDIDVSSASPQAASPGAQTPRLEGSAYVDETLLRRIDDMETLINTLKEQISSQQHGFGNQFAKMETSLDTFTDSNTTGIREIAERINDMQDLVQTFSGSSVAIKRLQMAMNDVIADVDELKFQQNNRSDSEDIDSALQRVGGGAGGSDPHGSSTGFNLSQLLASVKQQWREFREDLDNGLDYFADIHASDPEGSEALESVFIHRLAAFADRLDAVLFAFDQPSGKTAESVLDTLFHPLDALTVEVDTLMELDRVGRTAMGITFDDVTNNKSGGGKNIREEMRKVYDSSLPLLDQRVDKITMRRRIQRIENLVVQKSDKTQVAATEQELRRLLATKADQQDFLKVASKKVSLGEMAQFKDQVMKQLIAMRGYEYERLSYSPEGSTVLAGDEDGSSEKKGGGGGVGRPKGEVMVQVGALSERFDILHKRYTDLTTQCTTYVPREEVEQALQAILAEMRQMKNNSISPDVLKESLQAKANATEVQKLINALSFALGGDFTGKDNASAAIHSRCLVCDKPVRSIAEHPTASTSSPERMRITASTSNQTGMFYEKGQDVDVRPHSVTLSSEQLPRKGGRHTASAPLTAALPSVQFSKSVGSGSMAVGMGSNPNPNPNTDSFRSLSQKEINTRVTTEVTIMRSSIDLPPLSDQRGAGSSKSGFNIGGGGSNYKQRVRSSAGGGPGPNYSIDTR